MIRTEVPDYDTLQAEISRARRATGSARARAAWSSTSARAPARRAQRGARRASRRAARARRREPGHARGRARGRCPPRTSRRVVIADLADPLPDGPVRPRRVRARDPPPRRRREAGAVRGRARSPARGRPVRDGRRRAARRPRRRRDAAHARLRQARPRRGSRRLVARRGLPRRARVVVARPRASFAARERNA